MAARAEATETTRERLRERARALGVELDESALGELTTYLDELELWSARTNLVGARDRPTLIDRHVIDALAAVPLLERLGTGLRIADLGSGAGLPGLPLAIALRPREMILFEPRRKRASFLRAIRRKLGTLAITVVEGRAEELAEPTDGGFDAVVSRAALSEQELPAVAAPLLRHGGLLIAYRGGALSAPEPSAARQQVTAGYGPEALHPYELAGTGRRFALIVRERCRFT